VVLLKLGCGIAGGCGTAAGAESGDTTAVSPREE